MNKRILISLALIGAVAAIAVGGTVAYFSDTETSTGNLFAAGSIDLKIDNECYYNGKVCLNRDENNDEDYYWFNYEEERWTEEPCTCTWGLKDLGEGDVFFNFTDLKPGDWGHDTVSMHVYNNDAWACVTFDNLVSSDESCVEPELEAEPGCGTDEKGELAENLFFGFWADMCDGTSEYPDAFPGDNIPQWECDILLMDGLASDIVPDGEIYTLAAPGEINVFTGEEGEPLTGSEDYYIGKIWCFGDLNEPDAAIVCDGSEVDNKSQTDSLSGDIIFYAEQARNNPDFTCADWVAGQ